MTFPRTHINAPPVSSQRGDRPDDSMDNAETPTPADALGQLAQANNRRDEMDLLTKIANAVRAQRAETFARSDQMSLGELTLKCEAIAAKGYKTQDGEHPWIEFDFCGARPVGIDSWRGIYAEIAIGFEFGGYTNLPEFVEMLKKANGATFTGYKGGEYTMSRHTPVWVANYGESGNTAVIDVVDNGYQVVLITGFRDV